MRYLRLEKSVAWQGIIQQAIRKDPITHAPKLAQWFCEQYPTVFQQVACGICDSTNFKPAYMGEKFLPNRIYEQAPELPYYSHFAFPLIYSECLECGAARINPAPVRSWVDHVPPFAEQPGQSEWMEEQSYIDDKRRSISIHHEKMGLAQFQGDHARVLDVSCGSGVGLETLKQQFQWETAVGLECDAQAVTVARKQRKLDVHYGLIYELAVPPHSFDLVVMDNSLEHHWSPFEALQKIKRLLRPGGGLFIIVPNYHGYAVEHFGLEYGNMNWGHWHYYTVQSLQQLLAKTGFQLIKAYSSVCESIVVEKFHGQKPDDVYVELEGKQLANLVYHDKIFRGDFIHLLALSQGEA